ncbi:hypothetical protein HZB60_03650 [candidate division KSB1 bacterium]|nr:hypothetical protein [candidate division KSB1 bacterium]
MFIRPGLTRFFTLNFVLLDILIVGTGGVIAYRLGRANLIAVAEHYAVAAVNHLAWAIDKFYLTPWELSFDSFPYDNPMAHKELTGIVATFVSGFSVERVTYYDQQARVLFSTDSSVEHRAQTSNPLLRSALAGDNASELILEPTPAHMDSASGSTDHLLAYVPVTIRAHDGTSARIVFEVVMNVAGTYRKVEQLRFVIVLSTLATGIALFLVVWLIATRADRMIIAENRERVLLADQIREQNEQLESIVKQRTQQLLDAQAGLVQMEKMVATGQLAAGVAHEINNPVGIIQNRLEILLDDLRRGRPIADLETHLSMMHRQSERVSKIVSRLLSFARKSTTGKSPIQLSSVFSGVLMLVQKEIEKRGIQFNQRITADLPALRGNSVELEQVFINLLVNAMDATPRGGTIDLIAQRMNDRLQIQVIDSGAGIAPEHQSRIFDPFFTTKDVGVGTGLGLAITYRIVEDHDGTIMVASMPGHGTTFTLHFPILQPESTQS